MDRIIEEYVVKNYKEQCHASKLYNIINGETKLDKLKIENYTTYWGICMEPRIRRALSKAFELEIVECPKFHYQGFLTSIPDGIITAGLKEQYLLEIKTVVNFDALLVFKQDSYIEIMAQMITTGITKCVCCHWHPYGFIVREVSMDKELCEKEIIPRTKNYSQRKAFSPIDTQTIAKSMNSCVKDIIEYTIKRNNVYCNTFFRRYNSKEMIFFK